MSNLILITIFSLFFPVWLTVRGNDAITTGTLLIFVTLYIFFLHSIIIKKRKFKFIIVLIALIGVATVSTLSVTESLLGPSFRRYVQFLGALSVFFIIVNYYIDMIYDQRAQNLEFLLSFLIALFLVQILIGMFIYFIPSVGELLSIFTTRDQTTIETAVADGTKRLTSIIVAQESFGEILAALMPIVLYKMIKTRKNYYYIVYGLFAIGVILSATRSSIFLFFLGTFIFMAIHPNIISRRMWFVSIFFFVSSILTYFLLFQKSLMPTLIRFKTIFETYRQTGSIVAAANREGVWDIGFQKVIESISLFGNGMITIINNQEFHLHNLFLTVLHQVGIIGFLLFFSLIGWLFFYTLHARKLVKDDFDKCLLNAIAMSIIIFFLNELKFEFNRGSSYQQIIWTLLAIFYLLSWSIKETSMKNSKISI